MSRSILIVPEVLLAAPVAALAAAIPAALRLVTDQSGFFEAWLTVAGLLSPLLVLGITIARGARRTLDTLAPERGVALIVGVSLWALASLPATAILGAMLKANTHHRPLGGATFATFALAVHVASAILAWRVTALVFRRFRGPSAQTRLAVVLALAALVVVFVTVSGGVSASDAQPDAGSAAHLASLLVDGTLVLAAAVVASLLDVPADKGAAASFIGALALAFVAVTGVVFAARSPSLAKRLADQAPLAGAIGDAFGLASGR